MGDQKRSILDISITNISSHCAVYQEVLSSYCQLPYDSERPRALREHLKLSQTVLTSVLNTSASTVRNWEIGEKHPMDASLKLLNLSERKGLEALL